MDRVGSFLAGWLLPFALVLYLGLKGGGYDQVVYGQVGIIAWWIVVLGAAVAVLPLSRVSTAGWVGFGLLAVLGATTRPGAELVFELTGLPDAVAGADLVVTGEGSLDAQTLHGKAPAAVAALARDKGVPAVAVAGQVTLTSGELAAAGLQAAYALVDEGASRQEALEAPGPLLERIGARIAREHLGGGQ